MLPRHRMGSLLHRIALPDSSPCSNRSTSCPRAFWRSKSRSLESDRALLLLSQVPSSFFLLASLSHLFCSLDELSTHEPEAKRDPMSTPSPAPALSPQPSLEEKSPEVKEEEKPATPNPRLASSVPANPITISAPSPLTSPPPIQVAPPAPHQSPSIAPSSPAPSPSTPGAAAGDDIRAARAKYFSSLPAKKENAQEDGQQGVVS
jgi:hypothetical protein